MHTETGLKRKTHPVTDDVDLYKASLSAKGYFTNPNLHRTCAQMMLATLSKIFSPLGHRSLPHSSCREGGARRVAFPLIDEHDETEFLGVVIGFCERFIPHKQQGRLNARNLLLNKAIIPHLNFLNFTWRAWYVSRVLNASIFLLSSFAVSRFQLGQLV